MLTQFLCVNWYDLEKTTINFKKINETCLGFHCTTCTNLVIFNDLNQVHNSWSNLVTKGLYITVKGVAPIIVNICFSPRNCLGPKKQGFWPKINCSQMKLPNFVSPSGESLSKSANFGLSKWIFYVKNHPNLSEFFFHWRIIV